MNQEEQNKPSLLDQLNDWGNEEGVPLQDEQPVEEVVEEQEETKQPDPVPTPTPTAATIDPEAVAQAFARLQDAKEKPTPPAEPAFNEEEFNAKYRPKKITEQEIAEAMDFDPDLDAKKIKGLARLLNGTVEETYQKTFKAADLVTQQEIAKLKQFYEPYIQQASAAKQQQIYHQIGSGVAAKYPQLAQEGYREIVSRVAPAVFQRHANTPENELHKVIDDLAKEATTLLKAISPDFDPTKPVDPTKISQTNKTPQTPKQVNRPASLSTGGQSGGGTPRDNQGAKTKSLLDVLDSYAG